MKTSSTFNVKKHTSCLLITRSEQDSERKIRVTPFKTRADHTFTVEQFVRDPIEREVQLLQFRGYHIFCKENHSDKYFLAVPIDKVEEKP